MAIVYLCGPISGLTYEDATRWRDEAVETLTVMGFEVYSPMRSETDLQDMHKNRPIEVNAKTGVFARDTYQLEHSDIVLANLCATSKTPIGTLAELGIAWSLGKFVVLVIEDDGALDPPWADERGYHPFLVGLTQRGAIVNSFEEAYKVIGELLPVSAARLQNFALMPVIPHATGTDWGPWMKVQTSSYIVDENGEIVPPSTSDEAPNV